MVLETKHKCEIFGLVLIRNAWGIILNKLMFVEINKTEHY
jgi:hypothetical protein